MTGTDFLKTTRSQFLFLTLLYGLLVVALIARRSPLTPFGDEVAYLELGLLIRDTGHIPDLGSLRTYGYPFLISIYSLVSGSSLDGLILGTFIVQAVGYLGASVWLARTISDRRWAFAVLTGLLLNPLLVDLVVSVLTEGPTLIIVILLCGLLARASRSPSAINLATYLSIGSGLAALGLVIRPANIGVLVAWYIAVTFCTLIHKGRWAALCITGIASLTLSAIVFYPQISMNITYHDVATVFPSESLRDHQLGLGLKLWKYGTAIGHGPMNYPNPFFEGWPSSPNFLYWYVENPIAGPLTLAVHVFNAFSFDYPFVYILNIEFPSVVVAFPAWFVFALGSANIARRLGSAITGHLTIRQNWILPVFCFLLFGQAIALLAITAVENRFAMIPVAILSVSAAHAITSPTTKRRTIISCAAFAIVGTCATLAMKQLISFGA